MLGDRVELLIAPYLMDTLLSDERQSLNWCLVLGVELLVAPYLMDSHTLLSVYF